MQEKETPNKPKEIITLDLEQELQYIPVDQMGEEKPRTYIYKGIPNRKIAEYESKSNRVYATDNAFEIRTSEVSFDIVCNYLQNIENLSINGKIVKYQDMSQEAKSAFLDNYPLYNELQDLGDRILAVSKFPELSKIDLKKQ